MKRLFLFIASFIMLVILSGCNNWKSSIDVSTLKIEDDYIVGKIKNTTNNAYDAIMTFELKSGSLTIEQECSEIFKPNEIKDIKCLLLDDVDDSYKVELKNVELKNKEIPNLSEGKINMDALEYHFEEIYNLHTLNFVSFNLIDNIEENYPYIEEIEYKNNEIIIKSKITQGENCVDFTGTYSTLDNEMERLSFGMLSSTDEEFIEQILSDVAKMSSIRENGGYNSISIKNTLLRKDIGKAECIKYGNICISAEYSEFINFYSIHKY